MAFKGSFLGFSYGTGDIPNLIHSSTMGIVCTSNNGRFEDDLLPSFKDITASVNGSNQTYYFGSNLEKREFTVDIAFDSLTDTQLRNLRTIFGGPEINKLIFDAFPYKIYYVRASRAPQLKYMAFEKEPANYSPSPYVDKDDLYAVGAEHNWERVYKGEGTLSFIAYNPLASSTYKYINDEVRSGVQYYSQFNCNEWAASLDLKRNDATTTIGGVIYTIDQANNNKIAVYNPGDFDSNFKLYLNPGNFATTIPATTITLGQGQSLSLEGFTLQGNGIIADVGVMVNTELHLIQGYYIADNQKILTGNLYNRYITGGDFFKISNSSSYQLLQVGCASDLHPIIDYKYTFY